MCGSHEIDETPNGYVCWGCGIVQEIQKLVYYRPYNSVLLQHDILATTTIGSNNERLHFPNSVYISNLQRLQSLKSHDGQVYDQAQIEISRIFTCLNYPESYKPFVFNKFNEIYPSLQRYTKYRNPEKLVPVTIYYYFKSNGHSINESELLEVSRITKKEFNAFKLHIYSFFPHYAERNRTAYILQKVLEISEHFELGMEFYYRSQEILLKFWEHVKNTKDDVITGFISSLSALCLRNYGKSVSINHICKRLGIMMSTIQLQVKKRYLMNSK